MNKQLFERILDLSGVLEEALYFHKGNYYSLTGKDDPKLKNFKIDPSEIEFDAPDYDILDILNPENLKNEINKTLRFTKYKNTIPIKDNVSRVIIIDHMEYRAFDKKDMIFGGEVEVYTTRMTLRPSELTRIVTNALKQGLQKVALEDGNVRYNGNVGIIFNYNSIKYCLLIIMSNNVIKLLSFWDGQLLKIPGTSVDKTFKFDENTRRISLKDLKL